MNTSSTDRGSVALRTARWSATHPWRALLLWVPFVAGAVAAGSIITTQATTDADYRLGQSGRADQIITDAGLDAPDTENVLITPKAGQLDAAEAQVAAIDVRREMSDVDGVTSVGRPVWARTATRC